MLVVRDIHYIKINGRLFVNNASSNQLLDKLISQMGKLSVLAWIIEDSKLKADDLVPLMEDPNIEIIEIPVCLSIKEKINRIRNAVKGAKSLSLKFCFLDSFIACHFALRFKKPYVIESASHAFQSLWNHGGSIKYKLAAYPMNWLAKYYHAKSQNIIYVSKHFLQEKYPSNANQVGCSDAIIPEVTDDILQMRLSNINYKKSFSLGLTGNTSVEYRGHDTLIEVMALLRKKGYDVNVRFAGNPSGKPDRLKYASSLKVEQYVIFDGYLNQEEMFEWIDNDIDILVMPTLAETLGRAVIEAMSRGCPVIGSKETALPEQIGNDCIANARDVKSIADIIEHMITDEDYMKLCAIENYWRAKKYSNKITDRVRKQFYSDFFRDNGIDR